MNLTDSEKRLCDELVRDVESAAWPGGVMPDEGTPAHVIRAAYERLLARGTRVRLDGRAIMLANPPNYGT